jgi:hypothetical protein
VSIKRWLDETHGPSFELTRHFLLRFFDSDLVTDPQKLVVGAASGPLRSGCWCRRCYTANISN